MNPQVRIRVAVAVIMVGLVVAAFAGGKSEEVKERAGAPEAGRTDASRIYESDRGRQLLGAVLREDFTAQLPDWDQEYSPYEPDLQAIQTLAGVTEPVRIVCVLGTWCGDSEREVPRFWKILDSAANPALDLTMLAVGRSSDPEADRLLAEMGFEQNLREQYAAEFVPTFIFLQGDRELGRIVEAPTVSLEQDAALILDPTAPGQPESVKWE